MDPEIVEQMQAFVRRAMAAMRAVPLAVPASIRDDDWDGGVLDVDALYRAYEQLPAVCQVAVAREYQQCLDVLDRQTELAHDARHVRYRLLVGIVKRLQHASDARDGRHAKQQPDAPLPLIDIADGMHATGRTATTAIPVVSESNHDNAPRSLFWPAAAGSLVAAACLAVLAWQHLGTPSDNEPAAHTTSHMSTTPSTLPDSFEASDLTEMFSRITSYFARSYLFAPTIDDLDDIDDIDDSARPVAGTASRDGGPDDVVAAPPTSRQRRDKPDKPVEVRAPSSENVRGRMQRTTIHKVRP